MKRLPAIALALLLGVVLAGGHLALLQGMAWASMLISRASSGSFASAVSTTFDGRHPCDLCRALERHGHEAIPAKPAPDLTAKTMKVECLLPTPWRDPPPPERIASLEIPRPPMAIGADEAPPVPPPTRS